jgi:hypothetical protein
MLALTTGIGAISPSHASSTLVLNFQHIQLEDQNSLAKRFATPTVGAKELLQPASNEPEHPGLLPERDVSTTQNASKESFKDNLISRLLSWRMNSTSHLRLKLGRVIGIQLRYALMP